MNVNFEPALLIMDFCQSTGRVDGRTPVYNDHVDRQAFLDWIAADETTAADWSFIRGQHGGDDAALIADGLADREFTHRIRWQLGSYTSDDWPSDG